jgi:hypothetical protein
MVKAIVFMRLGQTCIISTDQAARLHRVDWYVHMNHALDQARDLQPGIEQSMPGFLGSALLLLALTAERQPAQRLLRSCRMSRPRD